MDYDGPNICDVSFLLDIPLSLLCPLDTWTTEFAADFNSLKTVLMQLKPKQHPIKFPPIQDLETWKDFCYGKENHLKLVELLALSQRQTLKLLMFHIDWLENELDSLHVVLI